MSRPYPAKERYKFFFAVQLLLIKALSVRRRGEKLKLVALSKVWVTLLSSWRWTQDDWFQEHLLVLNIEITCPPCVAALVLLGSDVTTQP
jgi:hypothetical protein